LFCKHKARYFIELIKYTRRISIENTEGQSKWTSRKTGKIRYTKQRKTKQKHNTICVGHHYTTLRNQYESL
jgi:hypothetical protein